MSRDRDKVLHIFYLISLADGCMETAYVFVDSVLHSANIELPSTFRSASASFDLYMVVAGGWRHRVTGPNSLHIRMGANNTKTIRDSHLLAASVHHIRLL